MPKQIIYFVILFLLASCGTDTQSKTPVPTEPPLEGRVQVTSPQIGSIIYAEVLAIAGTIEDVDAFQLQIETLDGVMLFDGEIEGVDGRWSREIVHHYDGEPIEAVIRAKSTNSRVTLTYSEVPILIASRAYREDGIFGSILFPADQQSVGGDAIEITGTASGIPNNRLSIMLRHDEGLIDKQIITLDNPYQIDERVWVSNLLTNGYQGEAFIDITYTDNETETEQILDTISIQIGSAAG